VRVVHTGDRKGNHTRQLELGLGADLKEYMLTFVDLCRVQLEEIITSS